MSRFRGRRGGTGCRRVLSSWESLERRKLLAVVTVDATQVVRPVNTQLLGVNVGWWDANLNTPLTKQLVQADGLTFFRLTSGGTSDSLHFNSPPAYQNRTYSQMASFIASVDGQAVVTLDYGSGSPQEAAAYLAYLNAPVGNTTPIGNGQEWNTSTKSWQTVDWKTANYWAGLRAAAPLAKDDGLNFLRLNHPAPFGFRDFEVGNEIYGDWETDNHTVPHDPATYVAFAKQFAIYAALIDPSISIGVDTGSPGSDYNNWITNVLQQSVAQGFMPGFLSDHSYMQTPGTENDAFLLLDTVSDPNSVLGWAYRANAYETLLAQYLGPTGESVELLGTEFNSVDAHPGKQTVSLVNGLFVADSLGALLETPYDGAAFWSLTDGGWRTGNNNSPSLYGWREGGAYGLLGDFGTPPEAGPYIQFPNYFAVQLASKLIQPGGTVVQAASDDANLSAYAVLESNGHLDLMVINKSVAGTLTGQFQITGFTPPSLAQIWQYGEAQDTAQSQTTDGYSALAYFTAALNPNGSTFSLSFPAYSMSVVDLGEVVSIASGPTITQAASALPSPVFGTSAELSVSASDPSGASTLIYTWSAVGDEPASVGFSANGTDAAASTTATFHKAGTYTFQVTATDPTGQSATSVVTVTVAQTLTTIAVRPASAIVVASGTRRFSALALDQFSDRMSAQPTVAWSVAAGGGTIDARGRYRGPTRPGKAVIRATVGRVTGSASVTIIGRSHRPIRQSTESPVSARVHFTRTRQGMGATGTIAITNTGPIPIEGWTLQFVVAAPLESIHGATIVNHDRASYTVQNVAGDAPLAPGGTVSIIVTAAHRRVFPAPTRFVLNGEPMNRKPSPPSGRPIVTATDRNRPGWSRTSAK